MPHISVNVIDGRLAAGSDTTCASDSLVMALFNDSLAQLIFKTDRPTERLDFP